MKKYDYKRVQFTLETEQEILDQYSEQGYRLFSRDTMKNEKGDIQYCEFVFEKELNSHSICDECSLVKEYGILKK